MMKSFRWYRDGPDTLYAAWKLGWQKLSVGFELTNGSEVYDPYFEPFGSISNPSKIAYYFCLFFMLIRHHFKVDVMAIIFSDLESVMPRNLQKDPYTILVRCTHENFDLYKVLLNSNLITETILGESPQVMVRISSNFE